MNELQAIGLRLGYVLNDDDVKNIMETTYRGETPEQAVIDYLNAYETQKDLWAVLGQFDERQEAVWMAQMAQMIKTEPLSMEGHEAKWNKD